jgi:predicted permease
MNGLNQDIKFGIRMMLKTPGVTALAILTLALGIGANTTVFSVVNALLLRPVAGVKDPVQLVRVGRTNDGSGFNSLTYPDFADYRSQNTELAGMSAYFNTGMHLSAGVPDKAAQRVLGTLVTGNYFEVLGVGAALGRTLSSDDDGAAGASPVAVISYGLWKSLFGSDPGVVGREVSINARSYTVVGVASEGFSGTELTSRPDIWVPIDMYREIEPMFQKSGEDFFTNRDIIWINAFARLKHESNIERARAQLSTVARNIEEAYPQSKKGVGVTLSSGLSLDPDEKTDIGSFGLLLMVTVGAVLLIACANVANLMLARGTARKSEIGIRLALGASRSRLARQLLTESAMLAIVGSGTGIFIAAWSNELLPALLPKNFLGIPLQIELPLDGRVLGFAVASGLVTAIVFGLVPSLTASKLDLVPVLKDTSRAGRGSGQVRLREALVIAQVSLSIVLLIGAGLFIRTLQNSRTIDLGFNPEHLLIAEIDLGRQRYDGDQASLFYKHLLDGVRALGGVESASYGITVPMSGLTQGTAIDVEGRANEGRPVLVDFNQVSPEYFKTMQIPILAGRDFTERDEAGAPGTIIINQTLATRIWPGENPLGKRLAMRELRGVGPMLEVVGVVADAKYKTPFQPPRPLLFRPLAQRDDAWRALHVRTYADPASLAADVQREVRELDPRLPVFNIRPLSQELEGSLTPQLLAARFVGLFGLLALSLAGIGLYGVMSYSVAQRTHEIGVRMALGAEKRDVIRMVVGKGLRLSSSGILVGVAGAFALTPVVSGLLYGVRAADPVTFVGMSLLLAGTASIACYVPARRATRVDPMVALRYE